MARAAYKRLPWWLRAIGNRMAPRAPRGPVATLSVPGRKSGRWRSTPVVVLDEGGEQFLVAPFGDTDWSRNLRAAGAGRLTRQGRAERFAAVEIPVAERRPVLDAYLRRYGRMPSVASCFRDLPDPADHPTFRITSTAPEGDG